MYSDDDFFLVDVEFDSNDNPIVEEVEQEEKEKGVSFFDLFNDISNRGDYIENFVDVNKTLPKEYNAFMMNKAFANFSDTIILANEMNKLHYIPDEAHWRFYRNAVNKRKRFSKWYRFDEEEPIELLAKMFDCSVREMRKNIHVIPKDRLNELIKELRKEK